MAYEPPVLCHMTVFVGGGGGHQFVDMEPTLVQTASLVAGANILSFRAFFAFVPSYESEVQSCDNADKFSTFISATDLGKS